MTTERPRNRETSKGQTRELGHLTGDCFGFRGPVVPWSRGRFCLICAAALIAVHLALLAAALPDYRVSIDAGYHVALARQYGEHLTYFWDTLHYQPAGRPNLRGPAIHFIMGMLGRALGGTGDDYVRANALLGIACWLAAASTVFYFARLYGRARAALVAVALFTGSAWAAASFYVNLPSGWVFVLTPWVIHLFLRRRLWSATALAAVACYAHLAGFGTVPFGLLIAALLTRRFRELVIVGTGVALLTAPYWIHFLRSLPWYAGKMGGELWLVDGLIGIFWIAGFLYLLRRPRQHPFLIAWALAPAAWLFQNPNRFILQSSLAGATIGAVALDHLLVKTLRPRLETAVTAFIVLAATVFPLGPPSLGAELTWLLTRYPRRLDWQEMKTNAQVLREHGLDERLTNGLGATAVSVWTPLRIEGGPWQRVRPADDGAERISIGERNYLLPIHPDAEKLRALEAKGWIRVHGGGERRSVITFARPVNLGETLAYRNKVVTEQANWIAEYCEHNTLGDWLAVFWDAEEIPRRRKIRSECRARVAHLQLATLLWAHALEQTSLESARRVRACADGLRALSALVGDEHALDYRNEAWHETLRQKMRKLGRSIGAPDPELERALAALIGHVRRGHQGRFAFMSAGEPDRDICLPDAGGPRSEVGNPRSEVRDPRSETTVSD